MIRRRLPAVCAFALAAALPLAAHAGGSADVRTLTGNVTAAGAERVSVDAPVGEFHLRGAATSTVAVEVKVRCEKPVAADCRRKAERIELRTETEGDAVTVEVRGWPKGGNDGLSLSLHVTVPRDLPLSGEFGVGELTVEGLEAGARLELGVGEMNVELAADSIRRADLEVGVGEAVLYVGGRRIEGKGFLGREIDWTSGRGRHALDAEVGVGEIEVRLVD
jgi:hypothetical protein